MARDMVTELEILLKRMEMERTSYRDWEPHRKFGRQRKRRNEGSPANVAASVTSSVSNLVNPPPF